MVWSFCDNCKKVIDCGFLGMSRPVDTIAAEIWFSQKRQAPLNKKKLYTDNLLFCDKFCCKAWMMQEIEKL